MRIFNTAATKSLLSRFNRLRRQYEYENGCAVDSRGKEWISEQLGISYDQLERYEMATTLPMTLDLGAGNNADDTASARRLELVDDREELENEVVGKIEHARLRDALERAREHLDPREREVVDARHGQDDVETLENLARRYGISRERVRQIEIKALDKMRRELRGAGIEGAGHLFFR